MLVIARLQNHPHEHQTSAVSFSLCNVLVLVGREDQRGQRLLSTTDHLFRMSSYRVDISLKRIEYQSLDDFVKDIWKRVH